MEFKIFFTVFLAVFIAELGDKTQIATMLFAADKDVSKIMVFLGSSLALICASGFAVIFGSILSEHINPKYMSILA
ncbi:MAG: TMEM165/GDT1 family protein, partial [Desulfobacteraceae bacterium]|nr:TMEM165/GDT1 family protein [Desulfobacteraceae bacterium]